MPLDNSSYALAFLRLDGRRWNELRRIHAQISTQAGADGSAYLEMGNTKVICTVSGPQELRRAGGDVGGPTDEARVEVDVNIAGFSGVDRRRRGRNDRRITELSQTLTNSLSPFLLTHIYPRSTISLSIHVLAQDGSLLAACINAATLALVDAGVPMIDMVVACSAGFTNSSTSTQQEQQQQQAKGVAALPGLVSLAPAVDDPLLDLSALEEQELPFLTVATVGATDKVAACVLETRVDLERLEQMLAVGLDGCKVVKGILDGVVRAHGRRVLRGEDG